jgi:uncharacterized protein HemY
MSEKEPAVATTETTEVSEEKPDILNIEVAFFIFGALVLFVIFFLLLKCFQPLCRKGNKNDLRINVSQREE